MAYYALNSRASTQLFFDFFVFRMLPRMSDLDRTFYSVTSIPLINVGTFYALFTQQKYRIIETLL